QIAVNDQIRMRVHHSAHGLLKELDARANGAPLLIAPMRERHTIDVFNREVWLAVVGDPRVEQARDVRVVQSSQDGSLAREALTSGGPQEAPVHELHGDLPRKHAVRALAGAPGA